MTTEKAIDILTKADASLDQVRNARLDYADWRRANVSKLDADLAETEPFQCFRKGWVFTGDGSGQAMGLGSRCGDWAAGQLLSGIPPETIIKSAEAELVENLGRLFEVSPVFGAKLEREIVLENGVTLIPSEDIPVDWHAHNVMDSFTKSPFDPRDCCVLRQDFVVSPVFVARFSISDRVSVVSTTTPSSEQRNAMRARVRAAMLLSCNGAIELPVSTKLSPADRLFIPLGAARYGAMTPVRIIHSVAIDGDSFRRNFDSLRTFKTADALIRAADRLGRARLDTNLTDVALDLGVAAEILLMHGTSSSNTEITYKLASRAAWLLGRTASDRSAKFAAAKGLYMARSDAVHNGSLSERTNFDRQGSDELVRAAIETVLLRGKFPEWDMLTLGASERSVESELN